MTIVHAVVGRNSRNAAVLKLRSKLFITHFIYIRAYVMKLAGFHDFKNGVKNTCRETQYGTAVSEIYR
jgi:hypothetical protein